MDWLVSIYYYYSAIVFYKWKEFPYKEQARTPKWENMKNVAIMHAIYSSKKIMKQNTAKCEYNFWFRIIFTKINSFRKHNLFIIKLLYSDIYIYIYNIAKIRAHTDELCDTNSTCQDTAERCYSNFKLARTFVAAVNNSDNKPTLSSRCKQQRDSFDKCAEEATLNATWLSICEY